jgi:tripartite-type tricarboxylate transporter receptor subunit TctC
VRLLIWLCLASLWFGAASALAQPYPSKPVRLIVPFGPGSGSDIVARELGSYLQERWKQPIVIENRPGAQGVIATEGHRGA